MFVGDVTYYFFDQVLDRQQAVDAAVFVHHQRQVHPGLAHLQQQVQHRDLRGHHQRAAQQRFELERLWPADIRIHVLDVHHADDLIELLAIDRQARVPLAPDVFQRLMQRHVDRHGDNVGAGDHDVVGTHATQAQHVGDQRPLLPIELRSSAAVGAGIGRLLHQLGDAVPHVMFTSAQQCAADAAYKARCAGGGGHGRAFHGLGTRRRDSRRASAISIRRASPGWVWSWPCK